MRHCRVANRTRPVSSPVPFVCKEFAGLHVFVPSWSNMSSNDDRYRLGHVQLARLSPCRRWGGSGEARSAAGRHANRAGPLRAGLAGADRRLARIRGNAGRDERHDRQPSGMEGSALCSYASRSGRPCRRHGERVDGERRPGVDRSGRVHARHRRCAGCDAGRGDPDPRCARRPARVRGLDLPARHAQQVGACARAPHRGVSYVHDRRIVRGAQAPQHPRTDDGRHGGRPRDVRCRPRRGVPRGSAAWPFRRTRARPVRRNSQRQVRLLPLGPVDRQRTGGASR